MFHCPLFFHFPSIASPPSIASILSYPSLPSLPFPPLAPVRSPLSPLSRCAAAWLQQAQAATYTIPWDFRKTRHVKPPYWMIPGDKLVFKWTDSVWHDLWIMDDEKAFKSCDFTRAKQLRPLGVGGQYT
ncbi:unnamed protein product [Closterium sp. Naga37s-1]|nr:unnamed protein product [Closterium sp. Naga37s-1]